MFNWSTNALSSLLRRIWNGRCKILSFTITFVTFAYVTLFVTSARNVIFSSVIEFGWRDIKTSDLIKIKLGPLPVPEGILSDVACPVSRKPLVDGSDIIASLLVSFDHLLLPEVQRRILEKGHGRFLPALNQTLKIKILLLYKVSASALDSAGVRHFLVDGSLLGLNRHKGFVPWDDDLDISVSLDSWDLVKSALSCIEGFTLNKVNFGHWKFHFNDLDFPFVDIFFYVFDKSYVWAVSPYTRTTFIYPTKFVFPLGESIFEGVKVPVPNDSLSIVKRIYRYNVCLAYPGHLKRKSYSSGVYPMGYSTFNVSCEDLSYMYSFY